MTKDKKKIRLNCTCAGRDCYVEFEKDDLTLWVTLKSFNMKKPHDVVLDLKDTEKLKKIL